MNSIETPYGTIKVGDVVTTREGERHTIKELVKHKGIPTNPNYLNQFDGFRIVNFWNYRFIPEAKDYIFWNRDNSIKDKPWSHDIITINGIPVSLKGTPIVLNKKLLVLLN